MELTNKKNHLYRIMVFFIMILFAVCLTMNVLLCSNYNLYELLDKAAIFQTQTVSECIVTNENGDNTIYFDSIFLNKITPHTEAITKNIYLIPMIADVPKGFSLFLFRIILFLFSFLSLFISLPDKWSLVNQKIRLDI